MKQVGIRSCIRKVLKISKVRPIILKSETVKADIYRTKKKITTHILRETKKVLQSNQIFTTSFKDRNTRLNKGMILQRNTEECSTRGNFVKMLF